MESYNERFIEMRPEEVVSTLKDLRKHCCMMAREEEDADKELWTRRERALEIALANYDRMWELALNLNQEFL